MLYEQKDHLRSKHLSGVKECRIGLVIAVTVYKANQNKQQNRKTKIYVSDIQNLLSKPQSQIWRLKIYSIALSKSSDNMVSDLSKLRLGTNISNKKEMGKYFCV